MKEYLKYLPFLFLVGCVGLEKDCSSCGAANFGADWIIVQYSFDGNPINCWKEKEVSVTNEQGSDGIWWMHNQHLIHISGWYNRVQVFNGHYKDAAHSLGIDLNRCVGGAYKEIKKEEVKKDQED